MLRFRLFGFPVEVQWMFWVVAVLLGSSGLAGSPNPGVQVVLWVGAVFVSILVHELGHTIFQRKYIGGHPKIVLWGMGGLAVPQGGRAPTRKQSIIISFMGPAFGLALGGLVWIATKLFPMDIWVVWMLLESLLLINIFWSLLNLLPVLPLDGGRILEAALSGRSPKLVHQISMVTAGIVALLLMFIGQLFAAILFGYLAYTSFQRLKGVYGSAF